MQQVQLPSLGDAIAACAGAWFSKGHPKLCPVACSEVPIAPFPLARDTFPENDGSQSPREREQPWALGLCLLFRSCKGLSRAGMDKSLNSSV